ncbi:MAG TPA: hypothetical protein VK188_15365 [Holophaga sp.]|nr:hypothetical protein [Holophaga sp.]
MSLRQTLLQTVRMLRDRLPAGARARERASLRAAWGRPVDRERDPVLVATWHDLLEEEGPTVDEATWRDLAMQEVFAAVDRTRSMPGRQWLYHQLRTYASGGVLAERSRQQALLIGAPGFREEAQGILGALDGPSAFFLAPLLLSELPERPWFAPLLALCSAAGLATLGGMVLLPAYWAPFLLAFLPVMAANIAINALYGPRISPYLPGFSQVAILCGTGLRLAALAPAPGLPQLATCRRLGPLARRLGRELAFVARDRVRAGGILQSMLAYLNLILLLDIQAFLWNLGRLKRHRRDMLELLEAVASLDAALAAASYRDGLPTVTTPALGEGRALRVRGLRHPLLAHPVGNDLDLDAPGALITGSNMTGKTTFVRTVGVNLILARTLHLCLAEEALLPRAVVRSSIRREDSQEEGKSYHYAELERIRAFVEEAGEEDLRLFLVDEIFRGTNTPERLASAAAVLRHLAERHLVLVTTHDGELQGMVGEAFRVFHFSEEVVDGRCAFDYRIHAGPARSRNAIRLLEILGYPEPITREAHRFADGSPAAVQG